MPESIEEGGHQKVNEYCSLCNHYRAEPNLTDEQRDEILNDPEASEKSGWCGFHDRPTEYGSSCYRFRDNPALG